MNKFLIAMAVVLATTWSQAGDAAVISRDWKTPGDGLLTYDDVNKREWLDLTETYLVKFPGSTIVQRYEKFLEELALGKPYEGFIVSQENDLVDFATSAGIETSTDDFALNHQPVEALINLVGISYGPSPLGARASFGLLDRGVPPNTPSSGQLLSIPESGEFGIAKIFVGQGVIGGDGATISNTGVWVFRNVPEPTGLLTAILSIVGLAGRKRVRQRRGIIRGETRLQFESLEPRGKKRKEKGTGPYIKWTCPLFLLFLLFLSPLFLSSGKGC